jgi:AbrB family looped-hinge helix DNA binding protein
MATFSPKPPDLGIPTNQNFECSARAKIGPGGRLVIPAAQRRELGLEVGDQVVIRVEDQELRVSSLSHRIERVQALVRRQNRTGEMLSESLIRGRRSEAATD